MTESRKSLTVLVADDDEDDRRFIARLSTLGSGALGRQIDNVDPVVPQNLKDIYERPKSHRFCDVGICTQVVAATDIFVGLRCCEYDDGYLA